jgi:hypothetical protein
MLFLTRTSKVDYELYGQRLNRRGCVYVDRDKLIAVYHGLSAKSATCYKLCLRIMQSNSDTVYYDLSRDIVLKYLQKWENVGEHRLRSRNVKGLSLNSGNVLQPLMDAGFANEFLGAYTSYTSLFARVNKLSGLLGSLELADCVGNMDEVLLNVPFTAVVQQNLRFNYNNKDIIAVPWEMNSTFKAPKGKCLVWGDIDQADMKVAYNLLLMNEENSKLMLKYPDTYEGFSRLIAAMDGSEFDYDTFVSERDVYKKYCLETVYGTHAGKGKTEDKFVKSFVRFLSTCSRYQMYKEIIEDRINSGLPMTIQGYFGHQEILSPVSDNRNKALNTPCQTTTSELVIIIVNSILDKFESLGFGSDDVDVYFVRHDEPIFVMSLELLSYLWVYYEHSSVQIDNWTPLGLKFSVGYTYTEPDEELMESYQTCVKINKHNITIASVPNGSGSGSGSVKFMPMGHTAFFGVGSFVVSDRILLCICNESRSNGLRADYLIVSKCDLYNFVRTKFLELSSYFKGFGYGAVVVYNPWSSEDFYDLEPNGLQIKFDVKANTLGFTADVLAQCAASLYCSRDGLEFTGLLDAVTANADLFNSVGKLGLINV